MSGRRLLPASTSDTASRIGNPMFPAIRVLIFAARTIAPTISVAVCFPFEPVVAIPLLPGTSFLILANNSMSPTISIPRCAASRTSGSASGTPGLMAMRSTSEKLSERNAPVCSSTAGSSPCSSKANGGASRLSATRTHAPRAASQRAIDIPLAPRPSTSARLFFSSIGTRLLHGGLDSRQPHQADIFVSRRSHPFEGKLPGAGFERADAQFLHEQFEMQTTSHGSPRNDNLNSSPTWRFAARSGSLRDASRCSSSCRLAQLERRQADQHQHHGDDPETNDDLILFPAFQFIVVVKRRHAKNAFAGQFERCNLQYHR